MNIIFLVILFPLMSFIFLSCRQGIISVKNTEKIGIISILMSFIVSIFYSIQFIHNSDNVISQKLWTWMSIDELKIDIGFFLDGLSLSMLDIVTSIGLLIHIFSIWYMRGKEGYSRFFAYTNLFIASMLILILADNFLFMYIGWEGVSICSYLLIGFYYTRNYNIQCAFKSFIITRISDIFLMIAFFLIYQKYGTLNFHDIYFLSNVLKVDSVFNLDTINILILIGVIGKSAQLPLQTWLTDAMVGPTPVSALIHAATMVTVGVYLISRIHFLFLLTPEVLNYISLIGTLTLLISSLSAIVQTDIKRILAYSTMSQIGYMFLALGIKAWTAAIFHLIIHAIFKTLLFLSAGSLIRSCNNEKNIFKIGASRKSLPFLYFNFLVGGGSLIAFPLITSGFYSKGNILFSVLQSGHLNLFFIALFCSFLTSIYTFRMIFVIFHGNNFRKINILTEWVHNFPLLCLLIGSTFVGSFISPPLHYVFPLVEIYNYSKFVFEVISSIISIMGVSLAYYLWIKNPIIINRISECKVSKKIYYILWSGWGFDYFYNLSFRRLYLYFSKILSMNFITVGIDYVINIINIINKILLKTVNGYIRDYALSLILSIILIFIFILFSY